jgi:hypothetical protein
MGFIQHRKQSSHCIRALPAWVNQLNCLYLHASHP